MPVQNNNIIKQWVWSKCSS